VLSTATMMHSSRRFLQRVRSTWSSRTRAPRLDGKAWRCAIEAERSTVLSMCRHPVHQPSAVAAQPNPRRVEL